MFLEIVKVEYLDNYRIKLWFNDGKVKIVDLADSLKGLVFEPLKDLEFFQEILDKVQHHRMGKRSRFCPGIPL